MPQTVTKKAAFASKMGLKPVRKSNARVKLKDKPKRQSALYVVRHKGQALKKRTFVEHAPVVKAAVFEKPGGGGFHVAGVFDPKKPMPDWVWKDDKGTWAIFRNQIVAVELADGELIA